MELHLDLPPTFWIIKGHGTSLSHTHQLSLEKIWCFLVVKSLPNCYPLGLDEHCWKNQNQSEDTGIIRGKNKFSKQPFSFLWMTSNPILKKPCPFKVWRFVHNNTWPKLTGKSQVFRDGEVNHFPGNESIFPTFWHFWRWCSFFCLVGYFRISVDRRVRFPATPPSQKFCMCFT